MQGESLPAVELTPHGLDLDRLYAFESPEAPPGMLRLTAAQRRELLRFRAEVTAEGVQVCLPSGEAVPVESSALQDKLPHGLRLTLESTPQTDVRPLSLVSLQTMETLTQELHGVAQGAAPPLDLRQFRANLYLDLSGFASTAEDAFPEDELVGRTLCIGATARIRILERDPRCRFFSHHPETLESNQALMKLLHRWHDGRAGVYAATVTPGPLTMGDAVLLLK